MPTYPTVDESRDRLHRAGWSVGETAHGPDHALVWLASGTNGENRVEAAGASQGEAWWRACVQAREVGMLAGSLCSGDGRLCGRRDRPLYHPVNEEAREA